VSGVLAGHPMAFEVLMRRHNQRLYRVARAVLRNEDEAEEVVQESYVRAFANMAQFEGRSTLATWLSRITLHAALRARRRRQRDRAGGNAGMEERFEPHRADHVPSGPMDRAELRSVLAAALDALPTRLRAVVMLRIVEGLDTRETAECLGMTDSNVKVCLHRARRLMAESIQRETVTELRGHFSFDGQRCDRIVAGVFRQLGLPPA
jgi:RNA polymerase sigma-70 factor (ECF subfamily)